MQQSGATEDSGNCCDITMCSLGSITGHGLQAELAERPAWETAAGMRVMRLWPQQGSRGQTSERKTKEVREDEQGSASATSMLYPPLPSTASRSFRTEQGMETAGHTDHLPDAVLSEKSCITGHATMVPLKLCALFGETRSKKTSGGD